MQGQPGKKDVVDRKQEEAWRQRLSGTAKGPFYLMCKKQWGMDSSLNQHGSRKGRVWKTRMRASAVPLQAELRREHRSETDACRMCDAIGTYAEDQLHMLVGCQAYEERRMVASIDSAMSAGEARALLRFGRSLTLRSRSGHSL